MGLSNSSSKRSPTGGFFGLGMIDSVSSFAGLSESVELVLSSPDRKPRERPPVPRPSSVALSRSVGGSNVLSGALGAVRRIVSGSDFLEFQFDALLSVADLDDAGALGQLLKQLSLDEQHEFEHGS